MAFFAVGLPGLLRGALGAAALREPVRGQADGIVSTSSDARPLARADGRARCAVLPPFTFIQLARSSGGSKASSMTNVVAVVALCVAVAAGLDSH